MPIDISWYEKGRVLYVQMRGSITLETLRDASVHIRHEMDHRGRGPAVHIIFDTLNTVSVPTQLPSLRRVMNGFLGHPQMGWMLEVTNYSIQRLNSQTIAALARVNWRSFSDMAGALEYIRVADPTLTQVPLVSPPHHKPARFL